MKRLAALLWLVLLFGCVPQPPQTAGGNAAAAGDVAAHELGRRIWNYRCYFCHGYSGDARTVAAGFLSPPPRDFTRTAPGALSRAAMVEAIRHGKPGTAMKGFATLLKPHEIEAVAGFVQREFIDGHAENTRYHTAENGWPDHERHRDAFPFARGEMAIDAPWEGLDASQQRGRRLFMTACITCHDHGRVERPGAVWETRAMSYPRDAYCTSCHEQPTGPAPPAQRHAAQDTRATPMAVPAGVAQAATYRVHDRAPVLAALDARERRGEALYQRNCAFCHAADGTAGSWIGRFLEPHPRDLTDPAAMAGMTPQRLAHVIAEGLEGTSMPAWKTVLTAAEIDAVVAYVRRAFQPLKSE